MRVRVRKFTSHFRSSYKNVLASFFIVVFVILFMYDAESTKVTIIETINSCNHIKNDFQYNPMYNKKIRYREK